MRDSDQLIKVVHVHDYCKSPIWISGPWSHPYRLIENYRIPALKEALAGISGKLLDFGCGVKPYEGVLRNSQINEWIGVDLNERTTGLSAQNKADTFWDGDILPLENDSFDI